MLPWCTPLIAGHLYCFFSDVAGLFGRSRRRTWRRRAATISQRQEPGATGAELCVLEIEAIRASWAARKRIEKQLSGAPGQRGRGSSGSARSGDPGDLGIEGTKG
jgi:hypothetical protein